jgi:hypothetical protein
MKILMGIVDFNPGIKDYALPKLYECLEKCVKYYVDILFISDREHPFHTQIVPYHGGAYSEDVLIQGREQIRLYAIQEDYDAFIWQGSDCYYISENDFLKFINNAINSSLLAIGALTSARENENYAVARRFVDLYNSEQKDIADWELISGSTVYAGFPGADALFIKKDLFNMSWTNWENFKPWYELRPTNPHSLCAEEFWCLKVRQKYGDVIGLDTSIRTYHAHEDGWARRWPGEKIRIEDLSFG